VKQIYSLAFSKHHLQLTADTNLFHS